MILGGGIDVRRCAASRCCGRSSATRRDKVETFNVMIQASLSGIIANIILPFRAVGETIAGTAWTVAVYTSNVFLPAQTMTAYIAQRVGGSCLR